MSKFHVLNNIIETSHIHDALFRYVGVVLGVSTLKGSYLYHPFGSHILTLEVKFCASKFCVFFFTCLQLIVMHGHMVHLGPNLTVSLLHEFNTTTPYQALSYFHGFNGSSPLTFTFSSSSIPLGPGTKVRS